VWLHLPSMHPCRIAHIVSVHSRPCLETDLVLCDACVGLDMHVSSGSTVSWWVIPYNKVVILGVFSKHTLAVSIS